MKVYEDGEVRSDHGNLLEVISSLRKIVNHPYLFFRYHQKVVTSDYHSDKFKNGVSVIRSIKLEELPEFKQYEI